MTGHILQACGKAPTVINGAIMKSPAAVGLGNIIAGSDLYVIEADESDGSIEKYHPHTGVISNITLDHQPLDELKRLFNAFAERCTYVIHNLDCEESRQLSFSTKGLSFSLQHKTADFYADNIKTTPEGIRFSCLGEDIHLKVPGKHNIANALAAAAAASTFDVDPADALHALSDYRGIKRRLETVGTAKGITVIDDFGHNPDKITYDVSTPWFRTGTLFKRRINCRLHERHARE